MKETGRPGIMLYFEDFRTFSDFMTDEQIGQLTKAIVNYAEYGEWVSDEADRDVQIAMRVFKNKIDRDGEAYEKKKLHGQYMTYVRQTKEQGGTPISEKEWLALTTAIVNHRNN